MSSYQSASFITYWLCIMDCELKTKNFQKRVLLTISPTLNTINKQLILLIFQGGALLKKPDCCHFLRNSNFTSPREAK